MLKRHELDRMRRAVRVFMFFLTTATLIGLGFLAWSLGGIAWFAFAAVFFLYHIMWDVEWIHVVTVENERATWGVYRELRRIRRGLPKTPPAG